MPSPLRRSPRLAAKAPVLRSADTACPSGVSRPLRRSPPRKSSSPIAAAPKRCTTTPKIILKTWNWRGAYTRPQAPTRRITLKMAPVTIAAPVPEQAVAPKAQGPVLPPPAPKNRIVINCRYRVPNTDLTMYHRNGQVTVCGPGQTPWLDRQRKACGGT